MKLATAMNAVLQTQGTFGFTVASHRCPGHAAGKLTGGSAYGRRRAEALAIARFKRLDADRQSVRVLL